MSHKTVAPKDFLTPEELKQVFQLKKAKLIKEHVIAPNIERINKTLQQENDPRYLAYALEYVVMVSENN